LFTVAEGGDNKDVEQGTLAGDLRVVSIVCSLVTLSHGIDSLKHECCMSTFDKF
jgi:hypothetical protein